MVNHHSGLHIGFTFSWNIHSFPKLFWVFCANFQLVQAKCSDIFNVEEEDTQACWKALHLRKMGFTQLGMILPLRPGCICFLNCFQRRKPDLLDKNSSALD